MNKPLIAGVIAGLTCVIIAAVARYRHETPPVWEGPIHVEDLGSGEAALQPEAPATVATTAEGSGSEAPSPTTARAVIARPTTPPTPPREALVAPTTDPMRALSPPSRVIPPSERQPPVPPPSEPPAEPSPDNATAQEAFRQAIRDSFREAIPEIRECYELVLDLEPGLSDRLVASMTVTSNPDGGEYGIAQLDSIEAGEMGLEHLECFADVIGGLQLPPPNGEESYSLRYPLIVNPSDK